jgi:hypothetical protein
MRKFAVCQLVLDEFKQIPKQKPGALFRFVAHHKAHNVSESLDCSIFGLCISQISQVLNPPE